jgi:CubicO group peptidase (beta-lactamase class C family)
MNKIFERAKKDWPTSGLHGPSKEDIKSVWIERAAGAGLDDVIAAEVTGPLGLSTTRFHPTAGCAATATVSWRGGEIAGEVHDDNAWAMGGVAGHAGLFSTAADVARLGAAWLDALSGAERWVSRGMAAAATRRRPSGRGLSPSVCSASFRQVKNRTGRGPYWYARIR